MADIDDIMDDIAKELADPNSALNAEMQGRTPENFNVQEELDNIGRRLLGEGPRSASGVL